MSSSPPLTLHLLQVSPHINQLREAGVTLTNYHVQEVCSPTRGAILTGRYPYHLGYQGVIQIADPEAVPLNTSMVQERLKARGYAVHMIGKW